MFPRPLRVHIFSAAVIVVSLITPALHATSVVAPTFPELVAESQLIARVEVTAIQPAWVETSQGRKIKTFVTFTVLRSLKGQPPATITVPFLGGELDGQGLRVEGMPRFEIGQTDIIFISDLSGVRFSPLVGLMHGRYRVLTDEATQRSYVARDDGVPLESETDVQLPQSATSPANRLKSASRALSPDAFEALVVTEAAHSAATR